MAGAKQMIFDRRNALLICASMGAVVFAPLADSQIASPGSDLRKFMHMRGLGLRPVAIGCLEGIYSGVVDGAVTPIFGVVSATFADYRELESGFEIRSAELAYFTDLDSGAVLETWKNPFTNELVKVPVSQLAPTTSRIGTDWRIEPEAAQTSGLQFSQSVAPAKIVGREVWFTETVMAQRDAGATEPAFYYNDRTVLRARLTDLDRGGASTVRSDTSHQSVSSWRSWMKMASHPGAVVGFGNGFYGTTIDELPPAWIKATEKFRPEILKDPARMVQSKSAR